MYQFRLLSSRLRFLVYNTIAGSPGAIFDLLNDFRRTVRTIYFGLRCLSLGMRRVHPPVGHPKLPRATRTATIRRNPRCAVSGMGGGDVKCDAAHVVPHAIGNYEDREDSPFYQLVEMMFPAWSQDVWRLSGGGTFNSAANLMVLAPTYHRMYDVGTLLLEPGSTSGQYRIRFKYPQATLRHTSLITPFACADLSDKQVIGPLNVCSRRYFTSK